MPDGYDSHADYMEWVSEDATARQKEMRDALLNAFARFVELREVEVINFSSMTAFDLAKAIEEHLVILKPIMASCNVAGRAIERDLDIRNVNTYQPRLTPDQTKVIAGYLKPFLPQELAIPVPVCRNAETRLNSLCCGYGNRSVHRRDLSDSSGCCRCRGFSDPIKESCPLSDSQLR